LERAWQVTLQKQVDNVISVQGVVHIRASKQYVDVALSSGGDSGGRLMFNDTREFCKSL